MLEISTIARVFIVCGMGGLLLTIMIVNDDENVGGNEKFDNGGRFSNRQSQW